MIKSIYRIASEITSGIKYTILLMIAVVIIALMIILLFVIYGVIVDWLGIDEYYDKNIPTEIFKIKETRSNGFKVEYFVISNPPNNKSLLKKTIEEYNFQTQSIDTIKRYDTYKRKFYRETECLARNYEEGKPYSTTSCRVYYERNGLGQQVRDHKSLVNTYFHRDWDSWNMPHRGHQYGYRYKDLKVKEININIDSFYIKHSRN
jgi:hypothetical protein